MIGKSIMLLGKVLRNRYKIVQVLGSGGFGDTYLAQDIDLPSHPTCVVKHFHPKSTSPNIFPIAIGSQATNSQSAKPIESPPTTPQTSAHNTIFTPLSSPSFRPFLWSFAVNVRTYAEIAKTLTPSPSPKKGEGNKKNLLLPFSRSRRRGWGMGAI